MGVSLKTIRNMSLIVSRGLLPPRARILEFGAQNVFCAGQEEELAHFIRNMRAFNGLSDAVEDAFVRSVAASGLMADLLTECGFVYEAIDIFPSEKALLFDLNSEAVPPDRTAGFDLVTNFGTTEHILNQLNCFTVAHDFTKPGGLIYHDVPMGGYFFHGYFSYTPLFFIHLGTANSYEIIYRHYWKAPGDSGAVPAPEELTNHGWPENSMQDWGIEFIFRKTTAARFRLPVEVGTAGGPVDTEFLNKNGGNEAVILGAMDEGR
jgi:hypothetical protein